MSERPGHDGEPTVVIEDLVVDYRVVADATLTARELLKRGFRSRETSNVRAIDGVSLTFRRGEAVGIVGSNGSGKSTLLRTIAGLQPRTSGRILVSSQPQFLGVAAALKLKMSGRRNIYLGGLALGLTVEEIDDRYAAVAEFSGLGKALGRPMQTYSSGMRARLAFSIATLTTPEILLLDEALAVGDRSFRERSIRKINQMREDANTVVLVTHNLGEIRQTCERVVWMRDGTVVDDGDVDTVLASYERWADELADAEAAGQRAGGGAS